MSDRIKYEKSSGNIFADIGVRNADEHFLRASLAGKLLELIGKMELTQAEAASRLGVKQPEVSQLKGGQLSHFSVERLLRFFNSLNQSVEIRISPARGRRGATVVKA